MPPRYCTVPLPPRHRQYFYRLRSIAPVCLLVCALCIDSAWAQMPTMTLDQAIRAAQQQMPGKLVAAVTERRGEQTVYLIRILCADGVVRTVVIDAGGKP